MKLAGVTLVVILFLAFSRFLLGDREFQPEHIFPCLSGQPCGVYDVVPLIMILMTLRGVRRIVWRSRDRTDT